MSYLQKGLRGISIIFIIGILSNVAGYFVRAFLARQLQPEFFGMFYAGLSLIIFLTLFTTLGFGTASVKYLSQFVVQKQYGKIKFVILSTGVIRLVIAFLIAGGMLFFSDFLTQHYFKGPGGAALVPLFALLLIFITGQNIFSRIFAGLQRMFSMSLIDSTNKFIFLGIILLFYFLGLRFEDAYLPVVAYTASTLLVVIIFLPFIIKASQIMKQKVTGSFTLAREVLSFAFASVLASTAYLVIGYLDTILLTVFRDLTEVGVYNVVLPTIMVLAFLPHSIHTVFFPMVSELWTKQKKKNIMHGMLLINKYMLFLLVPAALMLFTFPQEVIRLLFGNAYVSGALAMQILVLGILFLAVGLINQAVLLGTGRPKEVTIIVLIAAAFNGILNIIFIPVYGIIGAAASTTLSYLIIFLLTTHRIRGFVPLFDLFKLLVRFLTLSIVFVSVIFFFKTTLQLHPLAEAAISLAAAGTIYVLGARLLRIVSYREIRNFIKVVKG